MNQQLSLEVLIIGSGFSGLGAGIALKEMGVNDFVILERADDLGGTWRDNYIEVKQQAYEDNFEHVLKRRKNQLVFFGNCAQSRSYYFDKHGDVPLIRPATQLGMCLRSHLVSMNNYVFARRT